MNATNRLDPSQLAPEKIEELLVAVARPGHVALVDDAGNRTEIPEPLFRHMERLIRLMSERRSVVMIPEDETFTTQAAANHLGLSRQHLVNLLEAGEIPFHKVGAHRRVYFRDLLEFERKRDARRSKALDDLADQVDEAGLYRADYAGDS